MKVVTSDCNRKQQFIPKETKRHLSENEDKEKSMPHASSGKIKGKSKLRIDLELFYYCGSSFRNVILTTGCLICLDASFLVDLSMPQRLLAQYTIGHYSCDLPANHCSPPL